MTVPCQAIIERYYRGAVVQIGEHRWAIPEELILIIEKTIQQNGNEPVDFSYILNNSSKAKQDVNLCNSI
ncbi:MAG: hypothetical protein HY072_01980 [Deltaproteobacteria bacterium]|nr:hypothetical protein [Deltaproteobacteria bacterium]